MAKFWTILGVLCATAVACVTSAPAEDAAAYGHASNHEIRLSKEELDGSVVCAENGSFAYNPEFKDKIKPCWDPEIFGAEEGKKNAGCSFFCQGHAVGALDESGVPTEEGFNSYVDAAFPESNRDKVKEYVKGCLTTLAEKVDPSDDTCAGAGEFQTCIFKGFEVTSCA